MILKCTLYFLGLSNEMNRTNIVKGKHNECRVVKMCAQSTKISMFLSFYFILFYFYFYPYYSSKKLITLADRNLVVHAATFIRISIALRDL